MRTLILEGLGVVDLRLYRPQELQLALPETGSDDRWPRKTNRPVRVEGLLNEEERLLYRLCLLSLLDRRS